MRPNTCKQPLYLLGVAWATVIVDQSLGLTTPISISTHRPPPMYATHLLKFKMSSLRLSPENSSNDSEIRFSREVSESTLNLDEQESPTKLPVDGTAATKTVNERLLAELKAAENKEKFGPRTAAGKKLALVDGFGRTRKTDEEIQAAIEAARDLNGLNPIVVLLGSFFALGAAAGLWYATQQLGIFFALHPVDTDVYFVVRTSQVVRNVAMGLISLASGFFGVCGLGIFMLGVRVAYGVTTGELDPTPIKQNQQDKVDMPNVWDLMLNKKPNRRGGRNGDDNNPFGI